MERRAGDCNERKCDWFSAKAQKCKAAKFFPLCVFAPLLVIYFKDNSSLGNASPAEKIKRLKGDLLKNVQNLKHVTDFVTEYGTDTSMELMLSLGALKR